MTFRTDDFLSRLKVAMQIPSAQGKLTDPEILDLVTTEVFGKMVPLLRKVRGNRKVKEADQALVVNQARYRIPARTAGAVVRSVFYLDSNGDESPIDEIEREDAWRFRSDSSTPAGYVFYFDGDEVVLVPTPQTGETGSIRLCYYLRPGKLVLASACALATGVSATVVTTAASGVPATITSSTPTDLIEGTPQADVIGLDKTPTATTGTTITYAAGVLTAAGFAIGDYVALAGETPMIPLPDVLHPCLLFCTAQLLSTILGRSQKALEFEAQYAKAEQDALATLAPRSDGNAPKVVNHMSPARAVRYRGSRWRG